MEDNVGSIRNWLECLLELVLQQLQAMPQLLRIGPQGPCMRGILLHEGLGDVRHHGFGVFRIEPGVTINDLEATGLRPCPILRSKAGPLRIARSSSPGASIRETTWNPSAKPTQFYV
jgi:hypothetical protein